MDPITWIVAPLAFALGAGVHLAYRRIVHSRRLSEAAEEARRIQLEAEQDAAARLNEIELEGRERSAALERKLHDENKRRRKDLDEQRRALEQGTRNLERRHELLESAKAELAQRSEALSGREEAAAAAEAEANELRQQQQARLEQIGRMTAEQAHQELVHQIRSIARQETAAYLRKVQEEAREEAEREAQRLIVESLEHLTQAQMVDPTTTLVELPNEEMKGRIIGREGRNIRSLEMATGIDLLVDDTPRAILLSCFDPVRREIARLSVERLIEDGRIHPARIEEVVEKTRQEFEDQVMKDGEAAAFELGLTEVHPRLTRLVGRLRYTHLHGHNLMHHTRETVLLAGHMAAQLRVDAEAVRRAAFLHETGRVDDSGNELHPIQRCVDLAHKFNESDEVVRALRSLHPDEQERSLEGILVQIAHTISDVRPGARKENLDIFIHRMEEMENIARSFPGVLEAFAIKAGKELRVMVNTESVTDSDAIWLARDIARKIQEGVGFPGQIRVNVVRETRSVDYAM